MFSVYEVEIKKGLAKYDQTVDKIAQSIQWLSKLCLQSTIKHKICLHFRFRPLTMKKIIQYDSFQAVQNFNLKKAFFTIIRSLFWFWIIIFFLQMGGTEIVKSCWSNFEIGGKKQEKSEI